MSTDTKHLSPRELDVLRCAALGLGVKETAKDLILSPETVKDYRRNAIKKMRAASLLNAVAIAVQRKEIEVPA